MTNEFLKEYLEHISYEIEGLVSSYIQMTQINKRSKTHPFDIQGQKNDCLDLMALHFRNLYEFFCYVPHKGYIRASSYSPGFKGSANNFLINKANNQVSHFTEERHKISKKYSSKAWDSNDVMKWVVKHIDSWSSSLENDYREEFQKRLAPVDPFIKWYRDQIDQGKA